MPSLTQIKTLPHSAKQMYDLVMDIEKYPEFLPWCKQARIIKIISDQNLHADLLISFKIFSEKYRSDIKHGISYDDGYFIDVVAIEGPFKKLINRWKFCAIEETKCEVKFFIDFEFNSVFLTKIIGTIFEDAAKKMMMIFEERAKEIERAQLRAS